MRKARNFIREKKIYCGDKYLEIDIIPRAESEKAKTGIRSKKVQESMPKQKNLNEINAKRYFIQLINSNFGHDDLHTTVTYTKEYLPGSTEEAEKEVRNYIRRISNRRKKEGLPPLKYILVTEYDMGQEEDKPVRIHHHIIMSGGLDRDTVEELWRKPKRKGQNQGDKIGYANTTRLQPNEFGLEAIARYLTKAKAKGKKRWSCSQNLIKPWSRVNDHKYSRKKLQYIAKNVAHDPDYWAKQYPGYQLTECRPEYNDFTGWSLYLKLRKE